MADHTAGPWNWISGHLVGASRTIIRDVTFWNALPGDAPLIAAAPEEHAVLKAIVDCYGMGATPEKFCEHVHDFIMQARAIIAKVEASTPTSAESGS